MFKFLSFAVLFSLLLLTSVTFGQEKVGVVLSGGGATAMSHIGFLRSLEENAIPIDYITGSSMGAVIGGMYASGYTLDEIEDFVRSDQFLDMTEGRYNKDRRFYFQEEEPDATMVNLNYSGGDFVSSSLPTSIINPGVMDYNLMVLFAPASAASANNFDSLYIPFRCVASDIESKELVVFSSGDLAKAIRASVSYPFYIPPISVDGKLLYDGGLYNNFPADVMKEEFAPDVILGCNVSERTEAPTADDIISQLKSMIIYRSDSALVQERMYVIEPDTDVETFDFSKIGEAIDVGYRETQSRIHVIEGMLKRRSTRSENDLGRDEFKEALVPLVFDGIELTGIDRGQKNYVKEIFRKNEIIDIESMERDYFRLLADDKIKSAYPEARYNPESGFYKLHMDVQKERDVQLMFGGNFSSRPINTGFVGLKYNFFRTSPTTITANSYFGKFYGSIHLDLKFDIPSHVPFSIQPGFTFNRWDYFKSFATFFEEAKPSFTVINERYGGMRFIWAGGNKSKVYLDADYSEMSFDYYQHPEFEAADTADRTIFNGGHFALAYDLNTQSEKQFASDGSRLLLKVKYHAGEEKLIAGNTSSISEDYSKEQQWLSAHLKAEHFLLSGKRSSLGLSGEYYWSGQEFFQNYNATVISAQAYNPTAEAGTFFMPQFRSFHFAAVGLKNHWPLIKNLKLCLEAHMFSPIERIERTDDNGSAVKYGFRPSVIWSSTLVYKTIIGPISLSYSYYEGNENPSILSFNFGYIIFNRSIRE